LLLKVLLRLLFAMEEQPSTALLFTPIRDGGSGAYISAGCVETRKYGCDELRNVMPITF